MRQPPHLRRPAELRVTRDSIRQPSWSASTSVGAPTQYTGPRYRTILVPVDGSALSELAIPHARDLARAMSSAVVLLQVVNSVHRLLARVESPHLVFRRSSLLVGVAEREAARQRTAARDYLRGLKDELHRAGLADVSAVVRDGEPRKEIRRAVAEHACDVIVMASRAPSGAARVLAGSVADYVVRHLPDTPVLLVRGSVGRRANSGQ